MSAIFVDSAVEQMRTLPTTATDMNDLTYLLNAVNSARNSSDLAASVDTRRLPGGGDDGVFLVRKGHIHAILAVDPHQPDQIVVARVYMSDREHPSQWGATSRDPAEIPESVL